MTATKTTECKLFRWNIATATETHTHTIGEEQVIVYLLAWDTDTFGPDREAEIVSQSHGRIRRIEMDIHNYRQIAKYWHVIGQTVESWFAPALEKQAERIAHDKRLEEYMRIAAKYDLSRATDVIPQIADLVQIKKQLNQWDEFSGEIDAAVSEMMDDEDNDGAVLPMRLRAAAKPNVKYSDLIVQRDAIAKTSPLAAQYMYATDDIVKKTVLAASDGAVPDSAIEAVRIRVATDKFGWID